MHAYNFVECERKFMEDEGSGAKVFQSCTFEGCKVGGGKESFLQTATFEKCFFTRSAFIGFRMADGTFGDAELEAVAECCAGLVFVDLGAVMERRIGKRMARRGDMMASFQEVLLVDIHRYAKERTEDKRRAREASLAVGLGTTVTLPTSGVHDALEAKLRTIAREGRLLEEIKRWLVRN